MFGRVPIESACPLESAVLRYWLFANSSRPQFCVLSVVFERAVYVFNPQIGSVPVNWFCVYVRLCELLLIVQDGTVPATVGEGESPAAAAAASGKAVGEGTSDAVKNVANAAKDAPPAWMQFLPFIAIGLFFYFILLRPQQAEQRRRKELLTTLKKNDKVVTTGGMIGTIADISSDGTRVTLRVDDNTRIKFLRSAIQEPLKDTPESNGSGST